MPSYCIRRNTTYYFQQIVPKELQHVVGKAKICFSLHTGNKREAEALAKPLAAQNKLLWEELRRSQVSEPLDPAWLSERCKAFIFNKIKDEAKYNAKWTCDHIKQGISPATVQDFALSGEEEWLNNLEKAQTNPLHRVGIPKPFKEPAPYEITQEDYESFLEYWQLNIEPNSTAFFQANKTLLDHLVAAQKILLLQSKGDVVKEQEAMQQLFPLGSPTLTPPGRTVSQLPTEEPSVEPPTPHETLSSSSHPTITDLFDKWKNEHLKSGKTESTAHEYEAQIKRFCDLIGNLPVNELTTVHIRQFKDAMLNFPSYHKRYKGRSTKELVAMCKADSTIPTISPKTINGKCLAAVKAVLGYGTINGYLDSNPSQTIKATEGRKQSYLPFSTKDLQKLFSSPVYSEGYRPDTAGKDAIFWIPLIGLFTGARLEEIGQLLTEDIKERDGIHYFDMLNTGEKASGELQRFKTESSKRVVPIHSQLIKIGLLDYVEERRHAGDKQLFPHLREYQGKLTKYFSKAWGKYLRKHITTNPKKVFHSFRHTMKDAFREAEVNMDIADRLQGHALRTEGANYGQGYSLQRLSEAIEKIVYDVDFSKIRP